ncbi:MAG TPA: hypothetical protein VFU31_01470 [Candidatus Binatia bacterium]|nr:hypothetical protein [Candidatus Binatia bacterium]
MVEMDGSGAGLGVVAILAWQHYRGGTGVEGHASGNGRIKATEIDVAAKFAESGRSWCEKAISAMPHRWWL